MIKTRNLNLAKVKLLITGLLLGLSFCHQAQAASASANPADASNKHIYVDQYDLSTNLWSISGAGTNWSEIINGRDLAVIQVQSSHTQAYAGGPAIVRIIRPRLVCLISLAPIQKMSMCYGALPQRATMERAILLAPTTMPLTSSFFHPTSGIRVT